MQQSSVYFPWKWSLYSMRHPSHIVFNNIVIHYILHLITRFIQTRIYYSIGMKPIYIYIYCLYFVYLCTANRPAMVCIHLIDTNCVHWAMYSMYATSRAHSSDMVDDMLVTLLSGHKYYITIIYLKLQLYCWNYKSKLNRNIQESMHVLGDQIRIIQLTNYMYDCIL